MMVSNPYLNKGENILKLTMMLLGGQPQSLLEKIHPGGNEVSLSKYELRNALDLSRDCLHYCLMCVFSAFL